jgi:hypothetical protein
MKHYQQVELRRCGQAQVAWIPKEYARIGACLRIKEEEGWTVRWVYPCLVDDIYVQEHLKKDYRHQRQASDI